MNYFADDILPDWWGGELHLSTIKGKLDWRRTLNRLPCGDTFIEAGFVYNGASVGPLRKLPVLGFPKWKHPIATGRHDKRCEIAKLYKKNNYAEYKKLRKLADKMFKADVGIGGTWFEQQKGYWGVRLGSIL